METSANYLLSVDGGGTKTEFCVCDLEGNNPKTYRVEGSNYKTTGLEETYQNLAKGIHLIKEDLNITQEDIEYSVWGLSGCDVDEDYAVMSGIIRSLGFQKERTHLCNDGVLGFFAQATAPGLVIIAGTGSIIIGIDKEGNSIRRGGWGPNISDIGSGYWIGTEVASKMLLYGEGVGSYSPVFDCIQEKLKVRDAKDVPYALMNMKQGCKIAEFAKEAIVVAKQGDPVCESIVRQGVTVLVQLAKSAYDELQFENEKSISIVLSGGLFQNDFYINLVKEELQRCISREQIIFCNQKNSPTQGGICLARKKIQK